MAADAAVGDSDELATRSSRSSSRLFSRLPVHNVSFDFSFFTDATVRLTIVPLRNPVLNPSPLSDVCDISPVLLNKRRCRSHLPRT